MSNEVLYMLYTLLQKTLTWEKLFGGVGGDVVFNNVGYR